MLLNKFYFFCLFINLILFSFLIGYCVLVMYYIWLVILCGFMGRFGYFVNIVVISIMVMIVNRFVFICVYVRCIFLFWVRLNGMFVNSIGRKLVSIVIVVVLKSRRLCLWIFVKIFVIVYVGCWVSIDWFVFCGLWVMWW